MAERIWDRFLTEQDRAHVAALGPKPPFGFGSRPAVISIDNYRGGVGDRPESLLDSITRWPSSAGQAGWDALERVAELMAVARRSDIPVVHITGLPEHESHMAGWSRRRPLTEIDRREHRLRHYDIVEQAAPVGMEVVLKKNSPSGFFGTPLAGHLISLGVDTVILCGQATSGCVRATCVDARSHRFRVIVVEDAVYDRHQATAAMNLFDMNQKYADVLPLADVVTWMTAHAAGRPQESPDTPS